MSGLDVEALLDSAAANHRDKEANTSSDRDDRLKHDRSERRDKTRARDGSRDRDRDRKRHDRSRERTKRDRDSNDDDSIRSPRSERVSNHGGSRRLSRSRERGHHRDHRRRGSDEVDDKNGDFYRGSGRTRTRSGSPDGDRHYRPSGRDGHRDREDRFDDRQRDREPRRERERGGGRGREGRRRSGSRGKSRSKSPPLNEDERDRRTVFVQQLAARLRTKELISFFEKIGPVKEAQIVKDRVSGRSKGVGYVEFKNEESVPLAIQLTGQKLLGIPIIAQLTEAEKNRQARAEGGGNTGSNSGVPFHRLYVGNIHFSITETDLQNVFDPFGELEFVQLQKDEGGRSRGYGFVQFRDPAAAKEALEKMNGFDLAGRPIRVGLGNDKFTTESTANLLQRFPGSSGGERAHYQGSSFSGSGGRGAPAGGATNFDRASGREDRGVGGAGALDDSDVGGVNFNNFSREALMKKLARTEEPAEPVNDKPKAPFPKPRTDIKAAPISVPQASRCIVLRDMFNPDEEEGEDWVKELEYDVKSECEEKYGKVIHIAVVPDSEGEIYIKFERVSGGEKAIRGLNGRFFGGRQISAQPVVDAVYSSLFSRTRAM